MKQTDDNVVMNNSIDEISNSSNQSYNSSSELSSQDQPDEKNAQKNILIFHEQMNRYLLANPELKNLDFEKVKDPYQENQENDASKMWYKITQNILVESKRSSTLPSIEHFTQRLNLFQKEDETPDIIDIILSQKKFLMQQIKKEELQKQKVQNRINQGIKEKLNKETGLGGTESGEKFYSHRKKQELKKKMKEEQKKALEKQRQKKILEGKIDEKGNLGNKARSLKKEKNQKEIENQQKQKKRDPNFFDKLSKNKNEIKEESSVVEGKDYSLDIVFQHPEPEKHYRIIKKKEHESEAKKHILNALQEHRDKHYAQFKQTPSILQQGQKFFSEDSKEFTLFGINFEAKQKMAKQKLHEDANFFQDRTGLEQGNTYMLTKVNQILDGNLMKKWKELQEQKF